MSQWLRSGVAGGRWAVWFGSFLLAGCGSSPTAPDPTPRPAGTVQTATLTVDSLRIYDGHYRHGGVHYAVTLSVANSGDAAAQITALEIGVPGEAWSIRAFPQDRIAPGESKEFAFPEVSMMGPPHEVVATVDFLDHLNRPRRISKTAVPEALVEGPPAGTLAIVSSRMIGYQQDGREFYQPQLSVRETGGTASIEVKQLVFSLGNTPQGRVPTVHGSWPVAAGQTVELFEEQEPGYAATIDSLVRVDRVSVAISYRDANGRWGELRSTIDVTRD